jgi:hypothetical protein
MIRVGGYCRIDLMTMTSHPSKAHKITPDDPRHPEHGDYLAWLRGLSMEERGRMILDKCREAAAEERARIASGLPPTTPEPWPESTWELLRRLVRQSRENSRVASGEQPHE